MNNLLTNLISLSHMNFTNPKNLSVTSTPSIGVKITEVWTKNLRNLEGFKADNQNALFIP